MKFWKNVFTFCAGAMILAILFIAVFSSLSEINKTEDNPDHQFQEELLDITNVFCFNFETFRLEKYNSEFELDYIRPYNPDNLSSIVVRQIPGAIPNDFINKFGSKVKRSFVGVQTIDGKIFQFSGYAIGNTNPAGNIIGNPFIEDSSLKDFYTPQINQPRNSYGGQ